MAGAFIEKSPDSESVSVTLSESVSVSLGAGESASESEITQAQTSFPARDAGADLQREGARPLSVEEEASLQIVSQEDRETVLLARSLMNGTVTEVHRIPPPSRLTAEQEERLRRLREQTRSIKREAP